MNPFQLADMLLANNPNFSNNPRAKEFFDIIKSGDSVRGQQIAENICKSYGISKEEAVSYGRKFFNI